MSGTASPGCTGRAERLREGKACSVKQAEISPLVLVDTWDLFHKVMIVVVESCGGHVRAGGAAGPGGDK